MSVPTTGSEPFHEAGLAARRREGLQCWEGRSSNDWAHRDQGMAQELLSKLMALLSDGVTDGAAAADHVPEQ